MAEEKIEGCLRICREEWDQRGDTLRQTILCDFIFDDDFDRAPAAERRLGAWPLFRALIDALPLEQARRTALVTGRLTVIHSIHVESLGADQSFSPLATRPGWMRVHSDGHLVGALTRLPTSGEIQVLVGTRSLLGEGWDAPAVNSLVLVSYVGSYVLTNQMRGRAIRTDPNAPDKVASIWHLAAVTDAPLTGKSDLEALSDRCRTFVGLHVERPAIESGFARLALPGDLTAVNEQMFARLAARHDLRRQWNEAIEAGDYGRVVPSVLTGPQRPVRHFVFRRTLLALVYPVLQTLAVIIIVGLRLAAAGSESGGAGWVLLMTAGVAVAFVMVRLFRPLRIWLRHLPVDGSLRQMAEALRQALKERGEIQTESRYVRIHSGDDGTFSAALIDAPFSEQQIYADALAELLGPIDNSRYLIVRQGRVSRDYHAVPHRLSAGKAGAEAFQRAWTERIGPCELIYTRTAQGRKDLLKARGAAFSSAFAEPVERRDRWQ